MKKIFLFVLFFLPVSGIYSQTFTDVAIQYGINYANRGAPFCGGLSFCDFNKDGFDDLSFSSGTADLPGIFKNNTGSFQQFSLPQSSDVFKSNCITWVDYDNDGFYDLFITSFGGISRLYHNNGNLSFTDVTSSAGLSMDSSYTTGACWGDYDNDGYLDLYVNVYRALGSTTAPNILYHNEHNGTFTNKTVQAGVQALTTNPFVSVFIDYNNDGWPDLYITSDKHKPNLMYKNNGNGTFTDVSSQTGANLVGDAMGIAVGDYNNDGYMDMYVCNGEQGNFLLKNNGNGTFSEVSTQLGVGVYRVCWGCNFLDYDNDGNLDIFVCASNGAPDHKPFLFRNNGNNTFTRKTGIGMDQQYFSFGTAIGDINNDGYPDIAVVNYFDNVNLYKNSGGTNKWLKVRLQGNASNRDGIGSIIKVYSGGNMRSQAVMCGVSYLSQNSFTQMFGLGTSGNADSVTVKWPSGWKTRLDNVASNQTITINENAPIGLIHNTNEVPASFNLAQNYPNPFNPSTRIQYSLPKSEFVQLEVYDLLGNKIAQLINERKNAGTYEIEFDAGRFSSGIYFYKLTEGNFTQTNKMILVK